MYKIALFLPVIKNDNSLALSKFLDLFKQRLLLDPVIFCDNNEIFIDDNISIFSSIYMKQKFRQYIIITDIENINYIDSSVRILAIYNEVCQNTLANKPNITYVPHENNINAILQEISL